MTMRKQTRAIHPMYNLLLMEVKRSDSPAELALDLRRSWNHAPNNIWHQVDRSTTDWQFTWSLFKSYGSRDPISLSPYLSPFQEIVEGWRQPR